MSVIRNKKGQIAVEFLMMFVLVISIIIYAFYFAISFAALHYRSYEIFMVGRAVLSSSSDYKTKQIRARQVQDKYDTSFATNVNDSVASKPVCNLSGGVGGFRGEMDYGNPVAFSVFSNAGIACSLYATYILPSVITRSAGNKLELAIESMTGSEISEAHCMCGLDPEKNWQECLPGGDTNKIFFIDNGC